MAGLVAAFIFAVQMLNFPVAAGTSGHLLGGCLAAVLVGPYAGAVAWRWCWWCRRCCSPTAGSPRSGSTSSTWRSITAFGGYAIFRLILRGAPGEPRIGRGRLRGSPRCSRSSWRRSRSSSSTRSAAPAARRSPPCAAAMVGVHVLIGIGEGIITALTVGVVLGVRPDLVYGARDLLPTLELRDARPSLGGRDGREANARTWTVVVGGLLVALALAFFVSPFASRSPDGLNKVAIDKGFDDHADGARHGRRPARRLRGEGGRRPGLSTGLAGIIGVAVTLRHRPGALRRRRSPQGDGRRGAMPRRRTASSGSAP